MIKYICALPILFSGLAMSDVKSNYTDDRGMFDIKDGIYECASHIERTGTDQVSQGKVNIHTKKVGNGKLIATIDLGEKVSSPELPIATQDRNSVSYSLMKGSDDNGFGWSVKSVRDDGVGLMFIKKDDDGTFVFITDKCKYNKKI